MAGMGKFTRVVAEMRVGALRDLRAAAALTSFDGGDQIVDLLRAATLHGDVDPKVIADMSDVNQSTVYRWTEGRSLPHRAAWPIVVRAVDHAIGERIASYESDLRAA